MGFFKHAFHDVKHAFKTAGRTIGTGAKAVTKPVFVATNTVAGNVFEHVIKPVAHDTKKATQFVVGEGGKFAKKGEDFVFAEADVMVNTEKSLSTAIGGLGNFATKVETGVGSFLGSGFSYVLIGGAVIAAYVVFKR